MNRTTLDISKLDKAEALVALYNNSRQQGMGFMHAQGQNEMTPEQAAEKLELSKCRYPDGRTSIYFDYLHGRVMKVELGGDTLDVRLYDRDNGEGAAARALAPLIARLA